MASESDIQAGMTLLDEVEEKFNLFVRTKKASIAGAPYFGKRTAFSEDMTNQCELAEAKFGDYQPGLARSNFIKGKIWQGDPDCKDIKYMEKALALGYDEFEVRIRLAIKEEERGSKSNAIRHHQRIMELKGTSSEFGMKSATEIARLTKLVQGESNKPHAEKPIVAGTAETETWKPLLGQNAFQSYLELHVKLPNTKEGLFQVGENAIACLKCQSVMPLTRCDNCGGGTYRLGLNPEGIVGLFCNGCKRGFTSRTCACGCKNPITHETVLTKISKKSSGGCFIATAASGTANSPEVLYLSQFRDDVMSSHWVGRILVGCYYVVSPAPAKLISGSAILKQLTMRALVRPVIRLLRVLRSA